MNRNLQPIRLFHGLQRGLGGILRDLGDLEQANELYTAAVAGLQNFYGEEHCNTLSAKGGLGTVLVAKGELASARALLEGVVKTESRLFGEPL